MGEAREGSPRQGVGKDVRCGHSNAIAEWKGGDGFGSRCVAVGFLCRTGGMYRPSLAGRHVHRKKMIKKNLLHRHRCHPYHPSSNVGLVATDGVNRSSGGINIGGLQENCRRIAKKCRKFSKVEGNSYRSVKKNVLLRDTLKRTSTCSEFFSLCSMSICSEQAPAL